ncbi:MAG: aldo/keto reductase [bacterium]
MRKTRLGRSGLTVSNLCLGTMYFGSRTPEREAFDQLDAYVEAGGDFLDTSNNYAHWLPEFGAGTSERTLGKWMASRKNRYEIVLATKVRAPIAEASGLGIRGILRGIEGSLKRLGTDYVDLYWAHWEDWDVPLEETLYAFDSLVRQGKVRYIGLSNFYPWRAMKALDITRERGWAPPIAVQPQWSLALRDDSACPEFQVTFSREYYRLCEMEGLAVVPYSPLAEGFLTGKYSRDSREVESKTGRSDTVRRRFFLDENFARLERAKKLASELGATVAQVALAWLINQRISTVPIVAASSVEQLRENLKGADITLTEDQLNYLEKGG